MRPRYAQTMPQFSVRLVKTTPPWVDRAFGKAPGHPPEWRFLPVFRGERRCGPDAPVLPMLGDAQRLARPASHLCHTFGMAAARGLAPHLRQSMQGPFPCQEVVHAPGLAGAGIYCMKRLNGAPVSVCVGLWLSQVEHRTFNPAVGGSNPPRPVFRQGIHPHHIRIAIRDHPAYRWPL